MEGACSNTEAEAVGYGAETGEMDEDAVKREYMHRTRANTGTDRKQKQIQGDSLRLREQRNLMKNSH